MDASPSMPTLQADAYGPAERIVRMDADLPGILRALAFLALGATLFIETIILFRLGLQFAAAASSAGAPWSWLYDLGGVLAAPFAASETVRNPVSANVIEFYTLVAAEAYLFCGASLTAVLAGLALLSRKVLPFAWSWQVDLTPLFDTAGGLTPALQGLSDDFDALGQRSRLRGEAALRQARAGARRRTAARPNAFPGAANADLRAHAYRLATGGRRWDKRLLATLSPAADAALRRGRRAVSGVRERLTSPGGSA